MRPRTQKQPLVKKELCRALDDVDVDVDVETAYYPVLFSNCGETEIFWCIQLISDWLDCFTAKGISCLS